MHLISNTGSNLALELLVWIIREFLDNATKAILKKKSILLAISGDEGVLRVRVFFAGKITSGVPCSLPHAPQLPTRG